MIRLVSRSVLPACLFAAAALAACSDDDSGPCDLAAQTGCADGKVCEAVEGGEPACFAPVEARGSVVDLADESAIDGALVVALDVNRAPVTSVARTSADGHYRLAIPSTRHADGTPVGAQITLRSDAAGYQSFPSGPRQALPIDTSKAVKQDGAWVVESTQTEVGLVALPAGAGTGVLTGKVEVPPDHVGVLVIAETGEPTARHGVDAIADRDGAYTIFNVGAGHYDVSAYAAGHVYSPAAVDVVATATATADLALSGDAPGTISGQVIFSDPGGGKGTSVVLFVESTFDETIVRGAVPPGLRAPGPGLAPTITGAFTIDGVPPGRYVVVAAFENDGMVRDPDSCISGTDFVHVEVAAGQAAVLSQGFKVTGAIPVKSPGIEAPEAVTATPTLSWDRDASAVFYRVRVYDTFGKEVWGKDPTSDQPTQLTYDGPLDAGMYYQFRVTSVRKTRCEISSTEDLRGVFFVP